MRLITKNRHPDITPNDSGTSGEYGVEFFHIYTDENISKRHTKSIEYLDALQKNWAFSFTKIVLIDDYNPDKNIITGGEIISYLDARSMIPDYFAYESDLIHNADTFLKSITNTRTLKSYTRYIQNHGKYPCSLLTASWYLTRLGYLDSSKVIQLSGKSNKPFKASTRLINILPLDYKPIEKLALQLIQNSNYSSAVDKIEDMFYEIEN